MSVLEPSFYSPQPSDIDNGESRQFLNRLIEQKSEALRGWLRELDGYSEVRVYQCHDFVFQLYRDLWYVQRKWFAFHGRYFQGLPAAVNVSEHTSNSRVEHVTPVSQLDGWGDIGLRMASVPVQFWCDVYEGPDGHGYIVTCVVKVNGELWVNQLHLGPEEYRVSRNCHWSRIEPEFAARWPMTLQRTSSGRSITLFYSYAEEDEAHRKNLENHLSIIRRRGLITDWNFRKISAGRAWDTEISQQLEDADVVLFLVSSDFLASDYCYNKELTRALERAKDGLTRAIPVIVRPVDWADAPFAHLEALPMSARPVTTWSNEDEAWMDVARGIRQVVSELSGKNM